MDEVAWRLPKAEIEPLSYTVEAWDSASGRAAVGEREGRGRTMKRMRLVDTTASQQVGQLDVDTAPYPNLSTDDGRWLAIPDSDPHVGVQT